SRAADGRHGRYARRNRRTASRDAVGLRTHRRAVPADGRAIPASGCPVRADGQALVRETGHCSGAHGGADAEGAARADAVLLRRVVGDPGCDRRPVRAIGIGDMSVLLVPAWRKHGGMMSDAMGTFRIDVAVENPAQPGRRVELRAVLVDTGAELSV